LTSWDPEHLTTLQADAECYEERFFYSYDVYTGNLTGQQNIKQEVVRTFEEKKKVEIRQFGLKHSINYWNIVILQSATF
jgi:hypothetical protein